MSKGKLYLHQRLDRLRAESADQRQAIIRQRWDRWVITRKTGQATVSKRSEASKSTLEREARLKQLRNYQPHERLPKSKQEQAPNSVSARWGNIWRRRLSNNHHIHTLSTNSTPLYILHNYYRTTAKHPIAMHTLWWAQAPSPPPASCSLPQLETRFRVLSSLVWAKRGNSCSVLDIHLTDILTHLYFVFTSWWLHQLH